VADQAAAPAAALKWDDFLLRVFPENIAKAVAETRFCRCRVCGALGIALTFVPEKRAADAGACRVAGADHVKFTNIVMYYAPIGVGAAWLTVGTWESALLPLGSWYDGDGALLAFLLLVLLPLAPGEEFRLARFLKFVAEPATIAFRTSTSEAALRARWRRWKSLACRGPNRVFVIPRATCFNLMVHTVSCAASIFIAQTRACSMSCRSSFWMVFTADAHKQRHRWSASRGFPFIAAHGRRRFIFHRTNFLSSWSRCADRHGALGQRHWQCLAAPSSPLEANCNLLRQNIDA